MRNVRRLLAAVSLLALTAPAVSIAQEAAAPTSQPAAVESGPEQEPVQTPEAEPASDGATAPAEQAPITVTIPAAEARPAAPPIPAIWAAVPKDENGRSAYGYYLAGRMALAREQGETGAAYLAAVQALTPEQPRVREQAFTAALLAGDLAYAASITPTGDGVSPVLTEAGRLVGAVEAFAGNKPRDARDILTERPVRQPHARAALYLAPWIAAAAGDWDLALSGPSPSPTDITSMLLASQRAQLLEHRRRYEEADVIYKILVSNPRAAPLFRREYGRFLERRGRKDEALALYDAAIASETADLEIRAGRERVEQGVRPPAMLNYRQGGARALITAAQQSSAETANEFAAVYLRLALQLDNRDETRLLLGQTLGEAELHAAARQVLDQIGQGDPILYAAARTQMGLSFSKEKKASEALAEFERAVAIAPEVPGVAYMMAAQLLELDRHDEALAVLNGPLLNKADQGFEVRFLRGAAYESVGKASEAEAELWAALQLKPDDPMTLNYLGYLWVDSGSRVHEGAAMIAKALEAEPDNGNYRDSLGWAQYRQGQYELAVDTLEGAVDKEPANAEINDHLGDAYWMVGRRREAGFQWNRVLTLEPDEERKAGVERKLAEGLEPPTPVGAAPVVTVAEPVAQ